MVAGAIDTGLPVSRACGEARRQVGMGADDANGRQLRAILALVFLSGFCALVYEVLWLRQLGLLFGNTSQATAATLAVYFLGMAAGGYVFGRVSRRLARPLRAYALVEVGIAAGALLSLLLMTVFGTVYPGLFGVLAHRRLLSLAVRILVSAVILFPPTFFMGGTLCLIGQHLVNDPLRLGRTGTLVYAVNTAGGGVGAFLAGFYLPVWLGFRGSYVVAVTVNVLVALGAYALARRTGAITAAGSLERPGGTAWAGARAVPRGVVAVAALSGAVAIAMQVLWNRMLAQVFQNSVYSFSLILVVFLVSIVAGTAVARRLSLVAGGELRILRGLMIAGGVLVAVSPAAFHVVTGGMRPIVFTAGLWTTALIAAAVIVPAAVAVCAVFPFLLRVVQGTLPAGTAIGYLGAANTLGGVGGSLFAGFVLLEGFGHWTSVWIVAAVLPAATLAFGRRARDARWRDAVFPLGVSAAILLVAVVVRLPAVRSGDTPGESVLEVLHGSHATVSVVSLTPVGGASADMIMKLDNWYGLGSVSGAPNQRRLAHIPLLIHPRPRSVFFLGMATGITAGAALAHPVDRVVVCELSAEVVAAARKHFASHANGLFSDPRVEIVVEDGRTYLHGTSERFDVVVGDLFLPWGAGTGSLFTVEHFRSVAARLRPGGIYAQWLPLYQMSRREFDIVARTLVEVFGQVTLWRGTFSAPNPMVAFVCAREVSPLDGRALVGNARMLLERGMSPLEMADLLAGGVTAADDAARAQMAPAIGDLAAALPFAFYAGNVSRLRHEFAGAGLNTDDRPRMEYFSPGLLLDESRRFVGAQLGSFYARLMDECPPRTDPYLAQLHARERSYVTAGLEYYEAMRLRDAGREREALERLAAFMRRIGAAFESPGGATPAADGAAAGSDARATDPTRAEAAGSVALMIVPDDGTRRAGESSPVQRTDLEGTLTKVVVRLPSGLAEVTVSMARRWGLAEAELYRIALDNTRAAFAVDVEERTSPGGTRFAVITGTHPYVAARALMMDGQAAYVGERGALVGIPNGNALVVHPLHADTDARGTAAWLAKTVGGMAGSGRMPLSGKVYWYHDGTHATVQCRTRGDDVEITLPAGLAPRGEGESSQ
jgi:spermidine synthase